MKGEALTLTPRERTILRDVLSAFAGRIERAAIFGSRALGRARPASDIDLVLYGDLDDAAVARIWSLFDQSSLAVTVDVVAYGSLHGGSLQRHIDQHAILLFDGADLIRADRLSA